MCRCHLYATSNERGVVCEHVLIQYAIDYITERRHVTKRRLSFNREHTVFDIYIIYVCVYLFQTARVSHFQVVSMAEDAR